MPAKQRKPPNNKKVDQPLQMNDDCRLEIAESIPDGLVYPSSAVKHRSTYDAWCELIDSATERLDIVAFYWTLCGDELGTPGLQNEGKSIYDKLVEAIKDRKVKVRIVQNISSEQFPNKNSLELKAAGAEVRSINFKELFGNGVLHTKLILADGHSLYVGSANMDWRSLTQVKELGAHIKQCPALVADASKIFDVYWYMGHPHMLVPPTWPPSYNTVFNKDMPMDITINGIDSLVYFSSSPPPFCPSGRTGDIDALVDVIAKADKFVHIAVMNYELVEFGQPKRYWPVIDDALRKASLERGVMVRLLVSKWNGKEVKQDEMNFLRSLAILNGTLKADIQVKLFAVNATKEQSQIPYARVNHNKYMVTDKTGFIGTSNWSGDYFTKTAGVSLIISQNDDGSTPSDGLTVQHQLSAIFDRDWSSSYAYDIADAVVNSS